MPGSSPKRLAREGLGGAAGETFAERSGGLGRGAGNVVADPSSALRLPPGKSDRAGARIVTVFIDLNGLSLFPTRKLVTVPSREFST
jgi:hypothetical protein